MDPYYDARYLRYLTKKYNVAMSKGMGQNFLTDANLLHAIVADAGFKIDESKLINRIHPEKLFFANLFRNARLSHFAASLTAKLPFFKHTYMTILTTASK